MITSAVTAALIVAYGLGCAPMDGRIGMWLPGRRGLALTVLVVVVALGLPTLAAGQPAPNARPTGGTVVAGTAAIATTAANTLITQSTARAAINWQSFNVGSQQSVTIQQPSASAVTLVRVVGPDPTAIAGKITSNGQVVIVNAAGTGIDTGAILDDAGLMLSSANVANTSFMSGSLVFDQAGTPNAAIAMQGTIIARGGLVALMAPRVTVTGTITDESGAVELIAASTATVDLYGDGLQSVTATGQVKQAPVGPDGKAAAALLTLTGHVTARAGSVLLEGDAADGIVQNVVIAGGLTLAHHSTITVDAVGGNALVNGRLGTQATAGATGGDIDINATGKVELAATARLNASGGAGGGVIAVGTTIMRAAGGPGTPSSNTASQVAVDSGAQLHADALGNGPGGKVVILSRKLTKFAGAITASGGPRGGNGGTVEVSGHTLSFTGTVKVSAPKGTKGTLRLDPKVFL
jgi:filamentous hemagglutinin family protein